MFDKLPSLVYLRLLPGICFVFWRIIYELTKYCWISAMPDYYTQDDLIAMLGSK